MSSTQQAFCIDEFHDLDTSLPLVTKTGIVNHIRMCTASCQKSCNIQDGDSLGLWRATALARVKYRLAVRFENLGCSCSTPLLSAIVFWCWFRILTISAWSIFFPFLVYSASFLTVMTGARPLPHSQAHLRTGAGMPGAWPVLGWDQLNS